MANELLDNREYEHFFSYVKTNIGMYIGDFLMPDKSMKERRWKGFDESVSVLEEESNQDDADVENNMEPQSKKIRHQFLNGNTETRIGMAILKQAGEEGKDCSKMMNELSPLLEQMKQELYNTEAKEEAQRMSIAVFEKMEKLQKSVQNYLTYKQTKKREVNGSEKESMQSENFKNT